MPENQAEFNASQLFYVHKHTKCSACPHRPSSLLSLCVVDVHCGSVGCAVLSSTDALNMLLHVIENPDGGAGINLDTLIAKKKISVRFPLVCLCVHVLVTFLHCLLLLLLVCHRTTTCCTTNAKKR